MAEPFNDEGGSGFHVHVSVNDESGRNVFGDPGGPERAQILPMRLPAPWTPWRPDTELADVLGGYFVSSFLAYKRNEVERYVTDWEFREYAYHL